MPTDPVNPGPVVDTPSEPLPTDPDWRPPGFIDVIGGEPPEVIPDPETPNTPGGGKETGGYCIPEFCLPNWGGGQTWFERYGIPDTFNCCK